MKKLLMKISLVVALFGSGFAVNEMIHDNEVKATTQFPTPIQEMAKEEGFNLATIPSDVDNIFTQYFTITRVFDNVVEAKNTFYEYDIVFLEKTDFDNVELKEGVKIAVTYNHDTVVTIVKAEQEPKEQTPPPAPDTTVKPVTQEKQVPKPIVKNDNVVQEKPVKKEVKQDKPKNDKKPVTQEKPIVKTEKPVQNQPKEQAKPIVKTEQKQEKKQDNSLIEKDEKRANSTKEYIVTEDTQNKLIHAENGNEKYLLENDNYKKGDKIKVTFGDSGYHDDIKKQEKVMSDEDKAYKDAFEENAKTDINRNNPNYVQTEDGSYVPKSFWD